MYIGGLKVGALRADLMINWQAGKCASLIALQNDVAMNSLWRSTAVNIPRSGNFGTSQNISERHLYRWHHTSALKAVWVTTIMTITAALELMVAKLLLVVLFLGGIQKMPKRILKVHRTLTFLTQKKKFINFGFKSKYKNRES